MRTKKSAPRVAVRMILTDGRGGVIGSVDVDMPADLAARIKRD